MLDLIDGLGDYQITPFVVIPSEGEIKQAFVERGISYKILPVPYWVSFRPTSFYRIRRLISKLCDASKPYKKLIKDLSIDLIYTNSSVSPIGRVVSFLTGKPHVWHLREFLDLDYSYKFILPKWLTSKLILSSRAVVCNSNAVKAHYFNKTNRKIKVIYNGIATNEKFDNLRNYEKETQKPEIFTFAIVGFLHAKKGQDQAITAIAELKKRGISARLLIVGSGSGREFLEQCQSLAKSLGVDDLVEFLGFVSDPYEVYKKSSCLLMCSEHEAMGRVTVEAMSACLPVIGRKSGGTPELIVDCQTGFLYETFDDLVDRMALLINNPLLSQEMGSRAWEYAKERFTIEKYTKNIIEVLASTQSCSNKKI